MKGVWLWKRKGREKKRKNGNNAVRKNDWVWCDMDWEKYGVVLRGVLCCVVSGHGVVWCADVEVGHSGGNRLGGGRSRGKWRFWTNWETKLKCEGGCAKDD